MAYLKIETDDGLPATFVLPEGRPVVIGRQPGCDLVLARPEISRRHAELVPADRKSWSIRDLGSAHGTFVNRLRIGRESADPQILHAGDRIRIADAVLVFSSGAAPARTPEPVLVRTTAGIKVEVTAEVPVECGESAEPEVVERYRLDQGELVRAAMTVHGLDLRGLAAGKAPASMTRLAPPGRAAGPDNQLLTLVRISDGIHKCPDVDSVCRIAVEMALSASSADRGVIALRETEAGDMVQRARSSSDSGGDGTAAVRVSRTFVDRVIQERQALIARDVAEEVDLASARSVVAMGIRSIVCVPLLDGDSVLGYLYLDRIGRGGVFGDRDLDLLCLIGYQASAAIARLDSADRMREERDRRRSLARFFSADVIRHLEEETSAGGKDAASSARLKDVTVLFSDIQGFTAMSESMDPEELKSFLDVYFDRMTEILVDRHRGTLDKYIGDAIMALFGAPYSRGIEADAISAVAAALEMVECLGRVRREFPRYGDVRIRIGINSGRVVAGMMGSRRRLEYSVLGDPVNVASRLESSGEADRIQIGERTWNAVKDVFECEYAGERKVKNRAQPVRCWWVLGPRES